MKDYQTEYLRWRELAVTDEDIVEELKQIQGNDAAVEDAFYRDLAFGTGGLRGVIGAGTNRMNVYTVVNGRLFSEEFPGGSTQDCSVL